MSSEFNSKLAPCPQKKDGITRQCKGCLGGNICSIPCHAIALLHRSIWKNRLNSTFSFKQSKAKQLERQEIEQNLPTTDKTTFALSSNSILLLCLTPNKTAAYKSVILLKIHSIFPAYAVNMVTKTTSCIFMPPLPVSLGASLPQLLILGTKNIQCQAGKQARFSRIKQEQNLVNVQSNKVHSETSRNSLK